MVNGYRKIFWGLIISTFHLSVYSIQIIPAFVGWFIAFNGVAMLYKAYQDESFKIIKYLTFFMGIFTIITFSIPLIGIKNVMLNYTGIIIEILVLIFAYYLLTGSCRFLEEHRATDSSRYVSTTLRVFVILYFIYIIIKIAGYFYINDGLKLATLFIGLTLIVRLLYVIYFLKKEAITLIGKGH